MSASATLTRNRTNIQSILSADPHLIISKIYEESLITAHQYHILKVNKASEERVVEALDLILNNGETTCLRFLELLRTDEDLKEAFPGLKEILKDYVEEEKPYERREKNLLSVLDRLEDEEFKVFKNILLHRRRIPIHGLKKAERMDVVDLLMDPYDGPESWMEIRRALEFMNRKDLVQMLTETDSEPGDKDETKTWTPLKRREKNLLSVLDRLEDEEFKVFKNILHHRRRIPIHGLKKAERKDVVDLMMDRYGRPESWMEVTSALEFMNRKDLVQMLTETDSEPGDKDETKTWTPLKEYDTERILQEFLGSLTQDQFCEFKQHLMHGVMFKTESKLETASRRDTVKMMIRTCDASGAMEETRRVLKTMGSTDLVQRLTKICSTLEGPSTSDPSTPGPSTPGPSTSDPSTPGPSTPGPSTSDPSTSDPSTSGPSTPGLSIPGPTTPGPSTSDPSTPGPSTSDPSTSDPSTPGLSIPGPTTPGPSTPDPSTSDPSSPSLTSSDMFTSEPSTPSPSTSDKNLRVCEDVTEDGVDEDDEMSPHGTEKQHYVSTEAQAGPSDWEEFTPEDSSESGTTFYRFTCPRSGSFRCTRTGLVFVVSKKAGLQYRTVQWDEDLLESASRTAAGPLFSIECPENAVGQLHFPHCEIEPAPLYESLLSVAHITPHGMGFIEALEITDTHVVIDVPHLCEFGLNSRRRRGTSKYIRPVSGQVLLFLTPPNTLEMHLLSINVDVDDVKAFVTKEEPRAVYLRVPAACKLITEHNYTVDCCYEDQRIHCREKMFDLNFGPNYHMMFEIRLPSTTRQVSLTVKDQKDRTVWDHSMTLPAPAAFKRPPQSRPPNKKLLSVGRRQWRQQLSRRSKIGGKYKRKTKIQLFGILEQLEQGEFENFKWFLNLEKRCGITPIGKKLLENATRTDVVDLMVQRYEEQGAVEVTSGVLKNMTMNELRKKLRNLL